MIRMKKMEQAILETYREMYANCTVPADFDKLMAESPRDKDGRILIPFDSYYLEESKANEIMDRVKVKYKIKSKIDLGTYNLNVLLGCSPRFQNTNS